MSDSVISLPLVGDGWDTIARSSESGAPGARAASMSVLDTDAQVALASAYISAMAASVETNGLRRTDRGSRTLAAAAGPLAAMVRPTLKAGSSGCNGSPAPKRCRECASRPRAARRTASDVMAVR